MNCKIIIYIYLVFRVMRKIKETLDKRVFLWYICGRKNHHQKSVIMTKMIEEQNRTIKLKRESSVLLGRVFGPMLKNSLF